MHPMNLNEPPTQDNLHQARIQLENTRSSVQALVTKITSAEAALAQVVRDARTAIASMEEEKRKLEEEEARMRAYLSPIRRLPTELLREVFMWHFEEHAACAWVLASVCSSWRRLALQTPKIWSKIRLNTTPYSSPESIRLWLERSGRSVPLDIEIYLRVADPQSTNPDAQRRKRRRSSSSNPSWLAFSSNTVASHYVVPHTVHQNILPPMTGPFIPPPINPPDPVPVVTPGSSSSNVTRPIAPWAHIAFYYLVEQMPRWERFIFRYDRVFKSITALSTVNGDAPLLKEFEISSVEGGCAGDWPWLPNNHENSIPPSLPNLTSLTLQHVPFKWSSPIFSMNLRTLNLRAPLNPPLPLDRIRFMVSQNPSLENLSMYFQGVLPNVLPLTPLTLPNLVSLQLGGHYLLSQLLDSLILPSLKSLTLLVDPREPIEETITNLLMRSNMPRLERLSLGYETPTTAFMYYVPAGIVTSWRVLLEKLPTLKVLKVGGTPVDGLLIALGSSEDDGNGVTGWVCPELETFAMRGCMLHNEAVTKLVQMVEARNPAANTGASHAVIAAGVKRLKCLDMQECELGMDVDKWLRSRVENVVCVDPPCERPSRRRRFF